MTDEAGIPGADERVGPVGIPPEAVLDQLPVAVYVLQATGAPAYANAAAHELLAPHDVAAEDWVARASAGEPVAVSGVQVRRAGTVVTVDGWAGPIVGPAGQAGLVVVVAPGTGARGQSEPEAARLREERARHLRHLGGLRELQLARLEEGLDAVLDVAVRGAQDLVEGDAAIVGIRGSDGLPEVCAAAGAGATLMGRTGSVAESIMDDVVEMDAAAVLDDASSLADPADPLALANLGPALFVPLSRGAAAVGSLCVARRRGRPLFTHEEVLVAEVLANQVAMALGTQAG